MTAFANWRLVMPRMADKHRLIAPDMLGFGYTDAGVVQFDLDRWVNQCIDLLDALDLEKVAVIGNSFGGARWAAAGLGPPGSG